jgi:hypothetical protein
LERGKGPFFQAVAKIVSEANTSNPGNAKSKEKEKS